MRAVSLENAKRLAHENLFKVLGRTEHSPSLFGLAITGAHYQDRPSHGWIYIATREWQAYMHFSVAACADREWVGRIVSDRVQWLMNACMLSTDTWVEHINSIEDSLETHNIDVLYAPGVSDAERMILLKPLNPLVYHKGKFQRVMDYVRDYPTIYPGAFNPPTQKHLSVESCLYEISQQHYYKGGLSIEDMLHRVRMLDVEGRPTLLTQAPRFIDKRQTLTTAGAKDIIFVLGADAWNMTITAHQYPSVEWLSDRLPNTDFVIMSRKGMDIQDNQISATLNWSVSSVRDMDHLSSTEIREHDNPHEHEYLTPAVSDYIKTRELYT
jgi:nicotinic acid mononucleotide adenylyltransferase